MPKIIVDKSIFVNLKPNEIYEKLMDFNHWKSWSPWTIIDNDSVVTVDENNKHYHWKGELVGEGEMRIIDSIPNKKINVDLSFIKPFKSKAKVALFFKEEKEGTTVHWTLNNKLPFFMFFLKDMMTKLIGMDFDRGLMMLKEYLEEGEIKSKLEIVGESNLESVQYIGVKSSCSIDDISSAMQKDFGKLASFLQKQNLEVDGYGFSIYHEWKLSKNETSYTAAMPVKEIPSDLPDGFFVNTLEAHKTYAVRHIGPYKHLGNAWSAQFSRDRAKTFKKDKKFHPVELYISDPAVTKEEDAVTEIHMGIK